MARRRESGPGRLRLTWAGTFEPDFNRNRKLSKLLELAGVEVTRIQAPIWGANRVELASTGKTISAIRLLGAFPRLLWRLLRAPRPDVYLVSYPGWFDMPLVWVVARLKRSRVVFDPFISLFDTAVADRALYSKTSWVGRLVRVVDRVALRMADVVIADTREHLLYYDTMATGATERGQVIPLGADDSVFYPRGHVVPDGRTVVFHGTFVPLQGAVTVVEAADLLRDEDVRFLLIGDGQDRRAVEGLMTEREMTNIELLGLVPLDTVREHISRASICLGIFGDSDKAARVVPNKVYECVAMGRPVITRSGPAIDDAFGDEDVVRVPPRDAQALADAIRALLADPDHRDALAAAGRRRYEERFHESVLSRAMERALRQAVDLGR